VHEHNRITLAFIEIGDFNIAVVEARHRRFHVWEKIGDEKAKA
jgi:hypothetical protein